MTNTSYAQDSSEVNDHSITFMVLPSGKHLFPSKCLTWIRYQQAVVVLIFFGLNIKFHVSTFSIIYLWICACAFQVGSCDIVLLPP